MRATWILTILAIAASRAWAQHSVTLEIKPRVGDTLSMRLDQETEVTGVKHTSGGESSAMVITTMQMFSRAIIEGRDGKGTTVLAVTDSVLLTTTDEHVRAAAAKAQEELRGQRVRFRVAADGSVAMNEDGDGVSRDVAQVVSLIPAAFPTSPISVGESWIREVPVPSGQVVGGQLSGRLYVTFRFDSLTHDGDWAFLSMRGELRPATGPNVASPATLEKGTVTGTMLVDQRRRWLSESWFTIMMTSVLSPPLMSGGVSIRTFTRITQHMHTFGKR